MRALVYSVGFRHPAVLAKAVTAIDLLSGGRAAIGLGAGWAEVEYNAFGISFPNAAARWTSSRSAACVRGLLHDEVTSFEGRWFTLREARNEPRPAQAKLPIWIGGGGEQRTLRIAARYADGWNVPFMSPDTFARKRAVLHEHCARSIAIRSTSPAPSTSGWPGPSRACGTSSGPSPTSSVPACSAVRLPRLSTASATTSTPAPTRSTWPCARPSTSTTSIASPTPSASA